VVPWGRYCAAELLNEMLPSPRRWGFSSSNMWEPVCRQSSVEARDFAFRPGGPSSAKCDIVDSAILQKLRDFSLIVRSWRLRLREPAAPKRDQRRHQCGPEEDAYESE
jgi:hypothetical protein